MNDRIKEQEDEIIRYEEELEELNNDIDYYSNKIIRYNKQLAYLEEEKGSTLDIINKVRLLSMVHCDMARKLTDKSIKLQYIQNCRKAIKSLRG